MSQSTYTYKVKGNKWVHHNLTRKTVMCSRLVMRRLFFFDKSGAVELGDVIKHGHWPTTSGRPFENIVRSP